MKSYLHKIILIISCAFLIGMLLILFLRQYFGYTKYAPCYWVENVPSPYFVEISELSSNKQYIEDFSRYIEAEFSFDTCRMGDAFYIEGGLDDQSVLTRKYILFAKPKDREEEMRIKTYQDIYKKYDLKYDVPYKELH